MIMFVCRADSFIFMLICRAHHISGCQDFQTRTTEDTAHSGVVPHDMEEAVPQIMTFQPKSVASFA
jgi:hypothetical protein